MCHCFTPDPNPPFNGAGYPYATLDRAGRWTYSAFDAAGHATRVDMPNGDWVTKTYSGDLVTSLTDGASNTTTYAYDQHHRHLRRRRRHLPHQHHRHLRNNLIQYLM